MRNRKIAALFMAVSGVVYGAPATAPGKLLPDRVREGQRTGADFLVRSQDKQGAWGITMPQKPGGEPVYHADVGITALSLYALAKCPDRARYQGPIDKGVAFLMTRRRPDGSFADPDGMLVNYKTSVALLALGEVDGKKYLKEIAGAKEAIVKSLNVEQADVRNYGGAGYVPGEKGRGADLNNTVFAAEAIRRAEELGIEVDPRIYEALETYVTRVQNLEMTNDALKEVGRAVRPEDKGGFAYRVEESKANEGKPIVLADGRKIYPSYGSMTYAGLLSFIYARVAGDDPRVQAAWQWIEKNYTLDQNPGMAVPRNPTKGQEGLYYYYHTFAKAGARYGKETLKDAKGVEHRWAEELGEKILSLQQEDGSWINEHDRWYEGSKPLVTSYILVALDYCLDSLEGKVRPE